VNGFLPRSREAGDLRCKLYRLFPLTLHIEGRDDEPLLALGKALPGVTDLPPMATALPPPQRLASKPVHTQQASMPANLSSQPQPSPAVAGSTPPSTAAARSGGAKLRPSDSVTTVTVR